MRVKIARVLLALVALAHTALAQPAHVFATYEDAEKSAASAPRPYYPYNARAQGMIGRGVAVMDVNKETGRVTGARMEKYTGYALLDRAALEALRRWRFRPGTFTQVKVPISFEAEDRQGVAGQFAAATPYGKEIVLRSMLPYYPDKALIYRHQGSGVFLLLVRPDGSVSDVRVARSTRSAFLDKSSVATFRVWRFRPGSLSSVKIPVTFTRTPGYYGVAIKGSLN